MQMFLLLVFFIVLISGGVVFDLEPFSLFFGVVFGASFILASYYVEKFKESL